MATARIETTDPDQFNEIVEPVVGLVKTRKRHIGRFSARVETGCVSRIGVMVQKTRNICVRYDAHRPHTLAIVPLSGVFELNYGDRSSAFDKHTAKVTCTAEPFTFRAETATVLQVRIDNSLLRDASARLTRCGDGRSPEFSFELNLRTEAGRSFCLQANTIWSHMHADTIRDTQAAAAEQVELATHFLFATNPPSMASLDEHGSASNHATEAVQRVEDWIMSNLSEPICRADLCDVSGLHVRTLTREFTEKYNVGPMQFVRQQRLDAIRRILLTTDESENTVTRIAQDYCMFHLGRFAHEYWLRYHELPAATLAR